MFRPITWFKCIAPALLLCGTAAAEVSVVSNPDLGPYNTYTNAMAYHETTGTMYSFVGNLIMHFSVTGETLGSFTPPVSSSYSDIDEITTPTTMAGVELPVGTLLYAAGDYYGFYIFALDPDTGAQLAMLEYTTLGAYNRLGITWHAQRETLFLLELDSSSTPEGGLIREIDPADGSIVNQISVADQYTGFTNGDLDASLADGNLYLFVYDSSNADEAFEIKSFTPEGALVEVFATPTGLFTNATGISFDDHGGTLWVSTYGYTDQPIFELAGVVEPLPYYDFGDAKGGYPTRLDNDGARHRLIEAGPVLGALVDHEYDGILHNTARGDDNEGVDDEDGASFALLVQDDKDLVKIGATGGAALIDAWVDFNIDGDWDDAGEQVLNAVAHAGDGSKKNFKIYTPASAIPGDSFARVRISTTGGLTPAGEAMDGEVEDYPVSIVVPSITLGQNIELTEGATATVTVTLNAALDEDVIATYSTVKNALAKPGKDYVETSGGLTIPAGATSTSFTVQTLEDTQVEEDETFIVKLTQISNAKLVDGKMTLTIRDND